MLIRSQNRRTIVYFENAVLDIDMSYSVNGWFAIFANCSQSCFEIGTYSTREKAIKVLDMIQESHVNSHIDFQMPEDGEVEV